MAPDRRRVAVKLIQNRFGVSQRRACRVVGQHRSTQRRPKAPLSTAETELRDFARRDFARRYPRSGWREAHAVARREGLVVNPKRTRRVWRREGLQRPPQRRAKRRRLGEGTAAHLRARRPNHVRAPGLSGFDETAEGHRDAAWGRALHRWHDSDDRLSVHEDLRNYSSTFGGDRDRPAAREEHPFNRYINFWLLATAVGAAENQHAPAEPGDRTRFIGGSIFQRDLPAIEFLLLPAISHEKDPYIVNDPRKVLDTSSTCGTVVPELARRGVAVPTCRSLGGRACVRK